MRLVPGIAPKFILGDDLDLSEWLVHLHEPRFACRVRTEEFTDEEMESGLVWLYEFECGAFGNFVWIDPQPDADTLAEIFESAADFVIALDQAG